MCSWESVKPSSDESFGPRTVFTVVINILGF